RFAVRMNRAPSVWEDMNAEIVARPFQGRDRGGCPPWRVARVGASAVDRASPSRAAAEKPHATWNYSITSGSSTPRAADREAVRARRSAPAGVWAPAAHD